MSNEPKWFDRSIYIPSHSPEYWRVMISARIYLQKFVNGETGRKFNKAAALRRFDNLIRTTAGQAAAELSPEDDFRRTLSKVSNPKAAFVMRQMDIEHLLAWSETSPDYQSTSYSVQALSKEMHPNRSPEYKDSVKQLVKICRTLVAPIDGGETQIVEPDLTAVAEQLNRAIHKLVVNMGPSRPFSETKNVLAKMRPLQEKEITDFTDWRGDVRNNGHMPVMINLSKPINEIMKDVSLIKKKHDNKGRLLKNIEKEFRAWHKYGVFPYFDLKLWAKISGYRLSNADLLKLIWPPEKQDLYSEETFKRTTSRYVKKVFSASTLNKL